MLAGNNLCRFISKVSTKKMKPYQCLECVKKFTLESHLKRHTKAVHDKIRLFHVKNVTKNLI